MAVLLKKFTNNSKGIIVFSHKEWAFLDNYKLNEVKSLKSKFFLGFNVGSSLKKVKTSNNVDFAFTDDLIASFDKEIFKLELTDSNFLSRDFYNMKIQERYFDICAISSTLNLKKNRELLLEIKKLNRKEVFPNVIMILTQNENSNSLWHDSDLLKLKNELFNELEQKHLTIILISKNLGFKGIPQTSVNWFMNNSKFFYAGSEYEGMCRAAHEALLCGCKIIYYKHTISGIPKYLNLKNSISFSSYCNIATELEKALNDYKPITDQNYFNEIDYLLSSRYAHDKLSNAFIKLYQFKGECFSGNFINYGNLSNDLPAHNQCVPWHIGGTADILTNEQYEVFIKYINGINTSVNKLSKKIEPTYHSINDKIKYKLVLFKFFIRRCLKI